MASLPFAIRNLTSIPLELKLVEKFHAPEDLMSKREGVFKNLTSFIPGNKTAEPPTSPALAEHTPSFDRHEVSVPIAPFATKDTNIVNTNSVTASHGTQEVSRFTFEINQQRYRIDLPAPIKGSLRLHPLAPNPQQEITAIVTPPPNPQLTLYASSNLESWMKNLKDATPLSALSIPGTHNSPTHHRALPSVRCQAVSPREQLENGVRFFDIRVQPEAPDKPGLILVHSVFPISLTGPKYFRELIDTVYTFLAEHPSEVLIMSIKREGTGNATDVQLGKTLADHYTSGNDARRWYLDPRIPTLGEARGKIVLMRRFGISPGLHAAHEGRGWAIDAESWADNTPHDLHGNVCVQDFYEVLETENIDKKIEYCCQQLGRAADCVCQLPGLTTDKDHPVPPQPFYLNFLSASNFWKAGCWPEKIAKKVNPATIRWLCLQHHAGDHCHGDGGTGIVVCDWVGEGRDWDLVRCIVGMNTRLMVREMEMTQEKH